MLESIIVTFFKKPNRERRELRRKGRVGAQWGPGGGPLGGSRVSHAHSSPSEARGETGGGKRTNRTLNSKQCREVNSQKKVFHVLLLDCLEAFKLHFSE